MGNRISTEDLYKITQSLADRAVSDVKKRREDERKREEAIKKNREERLAAAAKQNRIPNYKGGSLWDQYKAALASGEAKNASDFITKRDTRNAAWNKVGAETLNDDMEALARSISSTYGTQFDPSKYYSQETINGSSDQVKKMRDRLNALAEYYNTYGGSDDQKKAVGEQIKAYDSELKFLSDLGAHYGQYKNEADFNYRTDKRRDEDYIVNDYDAEAGKKNLAELKGYLDRINTSSDSLSTGQLVSNARSGKKAYNRTAINEAKRQYGLDGMTDDEVLNWLTQEYQLESFALNNVDRMRTAAGYRNLANNEDFLQGVISGKAVENPTFEDYLNYENAATQERAEAYKKRKASDPLIFAQDTGIPDAPSIVNKLKFYEDLTNDKYGNKTDSTTVWSSDLGAAKRDALGYHYGLMTDDEKRVYYYLLGTQGKEAADKYLEDMDVTLDYRNTEEVKKFVRDLKNSKIFGNVSAAALANTFGGLGGAALGYLIADSNEGINKTAGDIAYSAASVPANVIGGGISTVGEIGQRLSLASKGDWEGKGYNPYENYNLFSVAGREARGLVAKDIEDKIGWEMFGQNVMSQVYQSLMSGADSAFGMATLGRLYTISMGGSAAASKAAELYESGASSSQIYWESLLSGIAEATFEYLSIENLSSIKNIVESKPTTLKKAIKMILTQNGVEASEEVFTEIANMVIDKGIKKYDSDYDRKVTEYVRDGMTREEAVTKAAAEVAADIGWAGAGGFISGFASSTLTISGAYRAGKENADAQISAIDPGNAEGLYNNAKKIDYSILNDASEALKRGDAETAAEIISEGKDWYEYLKSYAKEKYGKNQASEISANIDASIDNLNQIKNLISSGDINADSIQAVLEKAKSAQDTKVDMTSANDEKLFSLLAKGEPSNSVIEKNILKDRGTLAAFERLTGLRIGGTTVSQKRADVREAFKAVSSSTETLKAAQNAIESGATATEGHKNAAVIIDQAIQANRAENSRLRNSEKVKSAETKAAIDATNRQHRFLETVRNYVINGGDLSGFTESPVSDVSAEGGTNSSEAGTSQETAKKRVRADFSAYQGEITATEYNKAVKGSAAEQYTYFSNEEKKLNSDIKNIAESEAMTAEEKAEAIEKKNEEKNRLYALAKSTENVREMMRVKYAGNVDRLVEELQPKLKKYGIKIDVVDNIDAAGKSSSGAYFDRNTNTIKVSRNWDNFNNVVKLVLAGDGLAVTDRASVSFDRAVTQTIAHEIAHADSGLTLDFIKAVAGTQYDAFDLKGRLEHPDDRSWKSENAQKEENWRRYVDAYTEQAMLEMKGTEEQRRASAEKVVNDAYIFEEIMADMFGAAVDDMGHSGKAGENIFWAMNRNKPGIIKRILNALERFIAKIDDLIHKDKGAYLVAEQRQAAERLRDMLTGELKRAYGTEVKGEAAAESDGGKKYSLAGANSRTADLNSLGGAYQMYQNGVSMDTIRKRTGWWLGKDGKWRYEISDKEMRFNPDGYVDNPQTVGDYVKHDKLFAAYPWIADIPVNVSDVVGGDPSSLGRYVPSENFIELKTGVPTEKTKHVLIHELQHAIQNKEHFTSGTNSTVTSRYIVNLAYNNVKNNPEFKAEKSPRGKMDYIIGYLEARMDANFDDIAKYYYSRNHGEIEAQYADKRLDMSDNARKAEPIVNYGDVYTREDVRADFIDNLKEMGYNEEQVNEILEKGIPYDNKHQNEQESLGQTGEGRKNLAGEAGRLPRQGTQRGERREIYRTGKVQVADSVKKTGQVDSLSDGTIFRRGRTDSETGRNGVREAQKRLNEASKSEKRFSLTRASAGELAAIEKSGLSEADYFRKQAVKEFGYTPYFYDAGYIIPNGKMLNFSGEKGRHYGSRGEDHRAIGTIYADTEGTDALVRFMNDGNIRIMAETPGLDISASTEPSKEQYTTIRRFANEFSDGGYFAVDLSDENGKTVGTLEYEGNINPTRIVNDIKHFYETGEVREQSGLDRFRYSLTRANDEYMKAVESRNVEEQQRLVDEAAENAGYDTVLYHGTQSFGFTQIDVSKYSDDGMSFFATSNPEMAQTYSAKSGTREISRKSGIENLSLPQVVDRLNAVAAADTSDYDRYTYRIMNRSDTEALKKSIQSGIKELRAETERLISEYADRLAKDFNGEDELKHSRLRSLLNALDSDSASKLSANLYTVLNHNEIFDDAAKVKFGNLEADIRLLKKLAALKTDEDVVVREDTDRYDIVVEDQEKARNRLEKLDNSGNYVLRGRTEGFLEIDGNGHNWNDIFTTLEPKGGNTLKAEYDFGSESLKLSDRDGEFAVIPAKSVADAVSPMARAFARRYGTTFATTVLAQTKDQLKNSATAEVKIKSTGKTNTRDIANFAREQGYPGVKITDIYDNGGRGSEAGRGDVYIFFNPEQDVKSADPITYDNDGNVIPLSERFNSKNNDIRYSLTRANNEYMKAVESGDTEEQRRLVDEAAKANGYDRLFWHGSKKGGGFTEFRDWSYFTENKKYASRYAKPGDNSSLYEVYANLGNTFDTRKPECREIFDKMRSEYGLSKVQESGLPDWTDGYDIAEFIDENGLDYDSIILDEGGDLVDGKPVSRGFSYVIRSSEQVKSAAPITYDDSGNVIPLTERFDSGNRDIRYSLSANAAEEIKKALADKNYSSEIKLTDTTPTIMLGHNGVKNLPLMMRATHLRENILTREQAKAKGLPTNPGINYHGLGEPLFLDVIADLDNVKEAYRGTLKSPNSDRRENYFLLISEKTDASGNTINIPVFINETAKYNNVFIDVNKAATVFGREQLRKYINRKLADGSLVRIKRRSIQSSEVSSPIEPHYRKNASSIDNSVSQNDSVVNTQSMQGIEKDSSDVRNSLVKSAQSELKALQKENEKLRQDVDDLKQELQLTHGRKLSRDALISSIQKILIDGYGVRLSAKELYPDVTNLYDMFYNNTVDGKRLKKGESVDTMRIIEEMDKIVDAVIENAVGVDDTYVEMKKLLPELRNTKLVVPMDARADAAQSAGFENWAEFRKANFGRVGFANEGLPVDTYYMELSERYPELFPDGITNPGEQAAQIADVVNTIRESGITEYQLYDIEDERIRTSIKNDVMDIIGNAEKLQTFADRAAQKVEDTKLAEAMHYGADIAKLKRLNSEKVAGIRAENQKRLADMRQKYRDRVESVRERYAEARQNRSEKQKQTVLRNKVLRKYTEASTKLDRPTTENHFTEEMRKPLMEFLAAVDITTGKSVAKQGVYDRILRVIDAAKNETAEGGKSGLDIDETDLNVQEKQLIVDSGLLERMSAWVEANQGKKLTELSSAQLEELNGIFNQLTHVMAEIKRLYDPREGLAAKSWQAQKEIGLAKKRDRNTRLWVGLDATRKLGEWIHYGVSDAYGFFNIIGSDVMDEQLRTFRKCYDKFGANIDLLSSLMADAVGKDGIPKEWHGKKAKEITLNLSTGTLRATPSQLMTIHLLLNQEDSRRCLFDQNGGLVIGKFKAKAAVQTKENRTKNWSLFRTASVFNEQSGKFVLNEADAAKITAALTDAQIECADKISAILNGEAARLGNEVSMAMYGYKKYTIKNYFPMMTTTDYNAIASNPNHEMNLLGLPFTNERTGRSGKPLVAEDIFDVVGRHLTNMAQYNAFAQELDNAKKMYTLRLGNGTSLKQTLIRQYGDQADKRYRNLINNMSGAEIHASQGAEAISEKLLANYKAAAVSKNLSVVLKQPMSIFRALPEFSPAGLKAWNSFKDFSPSQVKAEMNEMLEHSGIAKLKNWGASENMTRKSFEELYNNEPKNFAVKANDAVNSMAEYADMWTWSRLWRMSKAEIEAQNKYTKGSKEYFEAVNSKFSEVIGKTQVVQSALDSSMAVQNAGTASKFLYAFQNEPLKQYSYLTSAIIDAARGKPGAKAKLAKVIASSLANTVAVSAISTAMSLLRGTLDRDDDDELWDDILKSFGKNVIMDLASGGLAPVWQIFESAITAIESGKYGNTVERMDLAALTDLGGLINKYLVSQKGGRPNLGMLQDIVNAASNLFGWSAKNVMRDLKAVVDRLIFDTGMFSPMDEYNYLKLWKDVELTNKAAVTEAYYDVIRDAVDRGRYSDYVKIKRDMIYHGYTETKIKNAVMKSSLMDGLYELKKVNPGSYKAKVNSIVSSVSAVSSLEGREMKDFIESAMKRREREDGGSKTDDEVYDEMHRKMEKEVKEQLIYIDVSKRAAYIKKMLKTYGEYGITEADILKVLRKAGKA